MSAKDEIDARMYGLDLFGRPMRPTGLGPTAERFGFPPFSVLDARAGEWQDRKRAWLSIGIKSEVGRDAKAFNLGLNANPDNAWQIEDDKGSGTSVFDPVLCELVYRWFAKAGSQVIDPFAGGSVRGIVAGCLKREYWGCDLSERQVGANLEQAVELDPPVKPVWVVGDSAEELTNAPTADLIFSCPPYGDLEVYSDDPRDLSAMDWHHFGLAYRRIIQNCYVKLRPNRFAAFVVGDFRDSKGFYRNFVGQTVQAFLDAGFHYYNEGILLTAVGTGAMRLRKQFETGRKFVKSHQNLLVFVKGDWREAAAYCGTIEGDA